MRHGTIIWEPMKCSFARWQEVIARRFIPPYRPPAPPEFPAAYPNSWLRIQRRGDRFSAFASTDGKGWKLYAVWELMLARQTYIGPALTSHNPETVATARFRNYTESK